MPQGGDADGSSAQQGEHLGIEDGRGGHGLRVEDDVHPLDARTGNPRMGDGHQLGRRETGLAARHDEEFAVCRGDDEPRRILPVEGSPQGRGQGIGALAHAGGRPHRRAIEVPKLRHTAYPLTIMCSAGRVNVPTA